MISALKTEPIFKAASSFEFTVVNEKLTFSEIKLKISFITSSLLYYGSLNGLVDPI